MSHKIGVLGDPDSVMPFKLLGFDVRYIKDKKEAYDNVEEMIKGDYGTIYIEEKYALMIPESIERCLDRIYPAIIVIPSHSGSIGIGKEQIRQFVEKAVGQNIL